jgi:predicted amidohydrolase YtcJ
MDKLIIVNNYHNGKNIINETVYFKLKDGIISDIGRFNQTFDPRVHFGSEAIIEDYRGYFVTPGIIDSHNHFTLTALKMIYEVDFTEVKNFIEIKNLILNRIEEGKMKNGWFLGYNLNEFNLKEKRLPTASDLDLMTTDFPIFITHSSEHYAVCNSVALNIAHINKKKKDPFGAKIGRFHDGQPNGILYESKAMDLVKKRIPKFTLQEYKNALSIVSEVYRNSGITTVKDIGGTGTDIDEAKRIAALNSLSSNGKLKIRVGVSIPVYSISDLPQKIKLSRQINENEYLKFVGFKIFLDGSALSRTAWMKEEWNRDFDQVDTGNYGNSLWNIDNFRIVVSKISQLGTTLSIHAIGDRAISEAIIAIGEGKKLAPTTSSYAIVHGYCPSQEDIENMRKLNISLETQTSFMYFIGNAILSNFGPKRGHLLFPIHSMLTSEINVCNGSDSPVTRYEPIYGILSSMLRKTKEKSSFSLEYNNKESVGLEETIRTYTSNCSKCLDWKQLGTLEVGSYADFVVWKRIPKSFKENVDPKNIFHKIIVSGRW